MKDPQVYHKICKYCGKVIHSLSERQLEINMGMHELVCPRKDNPKEPNGN